MEITDQEIVAWINSGQKVEQGYRILMSKYQEKLYWHIRGMVGTHEDAADVLQNSFIKAFRGMSNFKSDSSIYTWLYRIGTNEALTHLGKKKRMLLVDDLESSAASLKAVDDHIDGAQVELKLESAIQTLPPKQREVFKLRYYDSMAYAEMSTVLGTSVGALKASYHHAVKKIEAQLLNEIG